MASSVCVASITSAQPQDDAALAEVEETRIAPSNYSPMSPSGAPPTAATQDEEIEPPLTTDELRKAYPDLELKTTQTFFLSVIGAGIYPFQAAALGLGVDAYLFERLRLSAVATGGGVPTAGDAWTYSLYGEAGVGFVIARWPGQTVAALPVLAARYYRPRRGPAERYLLGDDRPTGGPVVRAIVPTSHSLELEGGAFTGRYPLYRCTAHCDEDPGVVAHVKEDAGLQVAFLYAGVRYVYYRWARSEQAPFRSMAWFEAAVDALTNPFTPDDAGLFNLYDNHPSHGPLGVRVKLRAPAIKCIPNGPCLGVDLMGGYLPSPADATFSINVIGVWQRHPATQQVDE